MPRISRARILGSGNKYCGIAVFASAGCRTPKQEQSDTAGQNDVKAVLFEQETI
jgi:hypothetical protein